MAEPKFANLFMAEPKNYPCTYSTLRHFVSMENQRLAMSETAAVWQSHVVDMMLSTDSETGFHNVLKQKFHTKWSLDGV